MIDLFAMLHDEFIDAIIDHFFEHDIDPIIRMGSIAQAANVHARAQADMRQGI